MAIVNDRHSTNFLTSSPAPSKQNTDQEGRSSADDGVSKEGRANGMKNPKRKREERVNILCKRLILRRLSWTQRLFALLAILVVVQLFRIQVNKLFGDGSMKGGSMGIYLDKRLLRYNIRTKWKQRREELENYGVMLPVLDIRNNRFVQETPSPFSHLAESISRTVRNKRLVWKAEKEAEQRMLSCTQQNPADVSMASMSIPPQILQPNVGDWYRPLANSSLVPLSFDEDDMRRLVEVQFPELLSKFDSVKEDSKRVLLFSLFSLYWYGGYAFGKHVRDIPAFIIDTIPTSESVCADHAVMLVSQVEGADHVPEIIMFASSPRHPSLRCLIDKITTANDDFDVTQMVLSTILFSDNAKEASDIGSILLTLDVPWVTITNKCGTCCEFRQGARVRDIAGSITQLGSMFFVRGLSVPQKDELSEAGIREKAAGVNVAIREPAARSVASIKDSMSTKLERMQCRPSWSCHRCLRTELFGSFESCSFVCNQCYEENQCHATPRPKDATILEVDIEKKQPIDSRETRIPRIIHQTYPHDLTSDQLPDLARLQNSWRASGFEFRFYNDTTAREYIKSNFRSRFLDAYDSFIPGAFKADLFRLLVLLKEGGIYADVDVLLEANLNFFLTTQMSFFVPRETIRDLAGDDYCLWNGLIGAAPGHPIIAKAVERLLASISNRADYLDVEQYACHLGGRKTPVWKLRALPTLILSGPCALGMATNEVLGRDILSKFEPGWLSPVQKSSEQGLAMGDMLILMADKQDMGYFRFSDVDRNLVVASTDMTDLSKKPLVDSERRFLRPHYSETEFASDVYGSEGVYVDKHAVDESIEIKLNVLHS